MEFKFQGMELKFPPSPTRWARDPKIHKTLHFHFPEHFGTNLSSRACAHTRASPKFVLSTFICHPQHWISVYRSDNQRHTLFRKGDSKFSRGGKNSSASKNSGHAHVPKKTEDKGLIKQNICNHTLMPSPSRTALRGFAYGGEVFKTSRSTRRMQAQHAKPSATAAGDG